MTAPDEYPGKICISGHPTVLLKNGQYKIIDKVKHIHTFEKIHFDFNIFDPLMWHKELTKMIESGQIPYKRKDGAIYHYRVYNWGGKPYYRLFPGVDENGERLETSVYGDVYSDHWEEEWAKRKRGEK